MQVFSYTCTLILKLDDEVKGPYISENAVGAVMIGINVLLALYFMYDITSDVKEHFAKLREEGLLKPGALSARNLLGAQPSDGSFKQTNTRYSSPEKRRELVRRKRSRWRCNGRRR